MSKPAAERWLEAGLFASRWLMAPFYVGLVLALGALLAVFLGELWHELQAVSSMKPEDAILMALSLIDLSLAGNLLLIVIYSGYENFVSRIDTAGHEDRPQWMGTVDFSGLKMKLIASIVAISAIALLKAFMQIDEKGIDPVKLGWMIGLHLTFVGSGVLLAAMDWLNSRTGAHGHRDPACAHEGFLDRGDGERLAWRRVEGAGPTLVWLGGFASDMTGTKAEALARWAERRGRSFLRFDYFGHGASSGRFEHGTISRWRLDVLALLDQLVEGEAVLVGSSMGGWLACLAALARAEQVRALVLIAPAADFTERLMRPSLPAEAHAAIAERGEWLRPSPYDDGGYLISRELLEDGARWSILPGPVGIGCPVRILQGGADEDVPWRHALLLAEALESPDLVFTLIRDGDHRLSRPQDIARLIATAEETG